MLVELDDPTAAETIRRFSLWLRLVECLTLRLTNNTRQQPDINADGPAENAIYLEILSTAIHRRLSKGNIENPPELHNTGIESYSC